MNSNVGTHNLGIGGTLYTQHQEWSKQQHTASILT